MASISKEGKSVSRKSRNLIIDFILKIKNINIINAAATKKYIVIFVTEDSRFPIFTPSQNSK